MKEENKTFRKGTFLGLAAAFAVSAALFAAPLSADASTYQVNFSGSSNSGTLYLDVTGTTVTGISGTTNGSAITGLSSYAGADQQWFYPTAPYVDFSGISWSIAGDAFGLGWTGAVYGLAQQSINPGGTCCGDNPLNLSVLETGKFVGTTPVPATLPLFVSGGGLLGGLLWRRKKKASAALTAVPA